MQSLFKTILFALIFLCLNVAVAGLNTKDKLFRNIWHPGYHCNRLAYCDGPYCGKPVADQYCQRLGYDCSTKDIVAYNVGLTHALSNRERCKGWRCDGFLLITCMAHLSHQPPRPYHYREREFVFPRYNNYRVDWCYERDEDCGARAANAFCDHLGFLKAIYFEKECHVNATKTIGSQELCFGPECTAFRTIICYR